EIPSLFEIVTPNDIKPSKIEEEPIFHFATVKEEPVADIYCPSTGTSRPFDGSTPKCYKNNTSKTKIYCPSTGKSRPLYQSTQ
ncbi:hypothetical protein PMAYCL1PPCAC_27897, partial [Pristionchus mayeri]